MVTFGTIVLLLASGGGFLAWGVLSGRWASASPSATGHGREDASSAERMALEEELGKEPCDRGKALKLAELLFRADQLRPSIERSNAFFARCGDFPRLRWVTYEAHKRLSEWDAAADEATKLIETDRNDKDYRWWRGFAYEQKPDLEKAASDYEQSLAIQPDLQSIPLNLANVYERMSRPCSAIFPLESLLVYHASQSGLEPVRRRVDRLYANPECAGMAGTGGHVVVRFPPGGGVTRVNVKLNDSLLVPMIVDTGASRVAISMAEARKLALPVETWPSALVQTAGGLRMARLGTIDEVSLQGLSARRVEVVVLDELGGLEGLLGQSFLSRFTVRMDARKGTLELSSRSGG